MPRTGLLLLHAFPLDHTMWDQQIAEFGKDFTVIAPDYFRDGATSMDAAADVAAEAVRSAGLDNVVVVGLSMGGYVALAFARKYPELAAGYLFANTRGDADDEAGRERRHALAARIRSEGHTFLADNPPPLLSNNAPGELLDLVKNIIDIQPSEAIAVAAEAMAARPDSAETIANISVPVLVVTSEDDTLIPPAITEAMTNHLQGARFETIANSGHLSNLEQPQEFNRLLRTFLVDCGVTEVGGMDLV